MPDTLTGPGTNFTGPIRSVVGEYDGAVWIPPQSFFCTTAVLTSQRIAAGNYSIRRPAAAQTDVLFCNISENLLSKWGADAMQYGSNYGVVQAGAVNPGAIVGAPAVSSNGAYPFGMGRSFRGFQLAGVILEYIVTTLAPTSFTISTYRRKVADNVATNITTNPGGAFTVNGVAGPTTGFGMAVRANPYSALVTIATPYVIGNNDNGTDDWLELSIVGTATAIIDILGMTLLCNYNLH